MIVQGGEDAPISRRVTVRERGRGTDDDPRGNRGARRSGLTANLAAHDGAGRRCAHAHDAVSGTRRVWAISAATSTTHRAGGDLDDHVGGLLDARIGRLAHPHVPNGLPLRGAEGSTRAPRGDLTLRNVLSRLRLERVAAPDRDEGGSALYGCVALNGATLEPACGTPPPQAGPSPGCCDRLLTVIFPRS